ncbi:hypothetical protein AAFF_G00305350 [Aldrovandia affinis]|uniref:DUF4590 domain-containing protein n=1 Tax=Aldrovandia affinis TaxID=143900 RepID=A0AAD7WS37_9TELE|nr:hypothetical protein AAFF_G00305350 [Aldrovandia affinis]
MSHLNSGWFPAYNSLTDKHLAGYFNNTRIRRHLRRAGLITRSGSIVPDKEYRHKLIRKDHQRHVRECLTQAIFHKVLDIEPGSSQPSTAPGKRQRPVRLRPLCSHSTTASTQRASHCCRHKESSDDAEPHFCSTLNRGTMAHVTMPEFSCGISPYRLPVINNYITPVPPSTKRKERVPTTLPTKDQGRSLRPTTAPNGPAVTKAVHLAHDTVDMRDEVKVFQQHCGGENVCVYKGKLMEGVINNYITPVPPSTKRKERSSNDTSNGRTRGRSLRPTTAPNGPAVTKDSKFQKTTVHSNVSVTMTFYGKAVHLAHDTVDMRDEVKVFQQHCGGENVCVYKGKLMEGEAFQFVSRRHPGFPFSLTFFLNGMQVERLSSCCEFRHRRASRLGGKHGHFGFTAVDRASPCYKCIIALGLDKKPTPPPKRVKSDKETAGFAGSSLQMARGTRKAKADGVIQDNQSLPGPMSSQGLAEDNAMNKEAQGDLLEEKEHKVQDDYEEDFEEEDEKVDEDTEETRALVVVNGVSSSPSGSHSDSKEDEEEEHREGEADEKDRYSDSEFEEEGKAEEKNKSASVSSESVSLFSGSRKEDPDTEAEEVKEAIKDNGVDLYPRSIDPTELRTGQDPTTGKGRDTTIPAVEEEPQERYLEAEAAGKAKDQSNTHSRTTSKTELDSEIREIHGRIAKRTALEESDGSVHLEEREAVNGAAVDVSVESTKISVVGLEEEDSGEMSAKSVQEKLTTAVKREANCSSEPEMSDCSSDEAKPPTTATDRTQELDHPDTGVEETAAVTFILQPLASAEKRNTEDGGANNDGAPTVPAVEQAQGEGPMEEDRGKVRTQETPKTEVQEEPDRGWRKLVLIWKVKSLG